MCGVRAGIFKTALLYPLDLACTRIATDSSLPGQARTYGTIRSCLADTFMTEGVRGLYKGMGLSLLVVVPYLSISFTAYDQLKVGRIVCFCVQLCHQPNVPQDVGVTLVSKLANQQGKIPRLGYSVRKRSKFMRDQDCGRYPETDTCHSLKLVFPKDRV